MTTISDIARETGFSTATVSNALTGKGRVNESRRKEIVRTAREMGYDFSRIRTGAQRRNVAVIIEQIGVPFCDQIVQGLCSEAAANDLAPTLYNLNLLTQSGWKQNPPADLVTAEERKVLSRTEASCIGMIYVSQYTRDLGNLLPVLPYPVICAYSYTSGRTPSVNYDDQQGAFLAVSYLTSIGRRHIAMISGLVDSIPMTKRFAGYQRALIQAGLTFSPSDVRVGSWTTESGEKEMEALLARPDRPDAVFCQNDYIAIGAMRAVRKAGLRVPEDIAITGFDNVDAAGLVDPALTTVAPPYVEIGRESIRKLVRILNKTDDGNSSIKLPCTLIRRGSA